MDIVGLQNKATGNKHDDYEAKLEDCIERNIDNLLKLKIINSGYHFYLREVFLSYKAIRNERRHLMEDGNSNPIKLNVLNRLIIDCENIFEDYGIMTKAKKELEPKKVRNLIKRHALVAYNLIK